MRNRILIKKELLPYSYRIVLNGSQYTLTWKYNSLGFFTVDIYNNFGDAICFGEPVEYGFPLWGDVSSPDIPRIRIIPFDESATNLVVTFENFQQQVNLSVDDELGGILDVG